MATHNNAKSHDEEHGYGTVPAPKPTAPSSRYGVKAACVFVACALVGLAVTMPARKIAGLAASREFSWSSIPGAPCHGVPDLELSDDGRTIFVRVECGGGDAHTFTSTDDGSDWFELETPGARTQRQRPRLGDAIDANDPYR